MKRIRVENNPSLKQSYIEKGCKIYFDNSFIEDFNGPFGEYVTLDDNDRPLNEPLKEIEVVEKKDFKKIFSKNKNFIRKNIYYDYQKWVFVWGFFLDQKKEVQKVLDEFNANGCKVVSFQYGGSKFSLFKSVLITCINFITLGFASYWGGFSIVFEQTKK